MKTHDFVRELFTLVGYPDKVVDTMGLQRFSWQASGSQIILDVSKVDDDDQPKDKIQLEFDREIQCDFEGNFTIPQVVIVAKMIFDRLNRDEDAYRVRAKKPRSRYNPLQGIRGYKA